tara:strand:- start:96 stop:1166 length:1071 start_codon:yes stop_codon:yes gene_type:complete
MIKLLYIEILRFFSSLGVLIFHYPFFFKQQDNQSSYELPFFNILESIYYFGGSGVVVFWAISGYIFYYIYSDNIINKNISVKKFFINRFSRLYPLHFLTLIIVSILQIIHLEVFQNFHHDYLNDTYHFFLNLFFASFWGLEKFYSFNGPIWSVSVEILVYFIFFYSLFFFKKPFLIGISFILFSALIKIFSDTTYQLLNCLIFFFTGGLAFSVNKYLDIKKIKIFKNIFYYLLLLILPYIFWTNQLYDLKYSVFIFFLAYSWLLLIGASIEINLSNKLKNMIQIIGNLTYGTYLFHFPVALLFKLVSSYFEIKMPIHSNYFFIFYLIFVLLLAFISFVKFEKPIQKIIRNKFRYIY